MIGDGDGRALIVVKPQMAPALAHHTVAQTLQRADTLTP